ncbi:MAG TPA: TIGR03621 family F420-dependent LLM class oxidoreductase [Ktedonobacteraceae bacterium]|jgi:probable F420-dependent oxidoreductase|nr:TIGR03621 family F420-dependent LLM class oxidoreductase [Ktedonobacteraceae bacterium]
MNRPFRFGVVAAYAISHTAWISTARRAEELGYATLLMPDRTTIGSFAPFPALAVAAGATKGLRVGSYVFCNEYRHPVILARDAATLDLLSEGRFELGLGAGVGPYEARQMGIPFADAGVRVGHLQEALQLIKQLFTEETVNFQGKYYTVTEMKGNIPPAQKPRMPILVAGGGERMLKLAAREADIIAIGSKITARGVDPTDATIEQKIAWIKEAAGERFAELELSQTRYDLEISDSKAAVSNQGPPIPKRQVSADEAVAQLLEQRERYGFSYIQVFEGQMENFAPIVAKLAGQ